MIGTPLEAGFSVLGWNHPGFGGSTVTKFFKHRFLLVLLVTL